jgi:hypothetical protein
VTDTTTDQTRTEMTTDPAALRNGTEAIAAVASDGQAADPTAAVAPRSERTADEIVAERVTTRDAAATGAAAPLSTADIAGGGTTSRGVASTPAAQPPTADQTTGRDVDGERVAPLFDEAATTDLRDRWTDVQAGFVDEPRSAVERADSLVAEVMQRLADSFATERKALEQQWSRGDDVSTEDLRVALRRYRSFFDRLLSF